MILNIGSFASEWPEIYSKHGPRPRSQRHQTVVTAIAPPTFGAMLLARPLLRP